jgi:hypothetical protein
MSAERDRKRRRARPNIFYYYLQIKIKLAASVLSGLMLPSQQLLGFLFSTLVLLQSSALQNYHIIYYKVQAKLTLRTTV